ncbi:MAG: hypothetical protein M3O71_02695 [Bacteroidota bacterium]|nr:hypothetical protein [Bacteroidota bacterium]
MKTLKLKSVVTGLMATAIMVCLTATTQANPVHGLQTDTGKMAKMDKMSKHKMSKDKMSKDKMSKDKMSKDKMSNDKMSHDKMSKDKISKDKVGKDKMAKKDTSGKM